MAKPPKHVDKLSVGALPGLAPGSGPASQDHIVEHLKSFDLASLEEAMTDDGASLQAAADAIGKMRALARGFAREKILSMRNNAMDATRKEIGAHIAKCGEAFWGVDAFGLGDCQHPGFW